MLSDPCDPVAHLGPKEGTGLEAEALGSGSLCPEVLPLDENGHCWIHHDDYDNIFVMSLDPTGPASVLRLSLPLAE